MRTVDPAKHKARRQHIVDAAAQLFATKGFERTTTAEICRAAGMSAGNLFHYFANKRAIFLAVFEDEDSDKAERMAAAETAEDPWNALLEVIDLLAAPALEPLAPHLVMEAMVRAYRDPEVEAALSSSTADEQKTVAVLLRRARRRPDRPGAGSRRHGCLGRDPDRLALHRRRHRPDVQARRATPHPAADPDPLPPRRSAPVAGPGDRLCQTVDPLFSLVG